MRVRNAWYAAGWSGELGRRPLGRELFGRRIALFRGPDGRACAVGARCPHRGADLSQGRCIEGTLECPFHGWRFDARGRCVSIPSQPDRVKRPPGAKLDSFAVAEGEGVVWLRTEAGYGPSAPSEPPARELNGRRVLLPPMLVRAPFLRVLENTLDTAHNPFIHRGAFGPRLDPLVPQQKVHVDADGRGLRAQEDPASRWRPSGPLVTGIFGLAARLLGQTSPTVRYSRFELGGRVTSYAQYASGRWDAFTLYLTPADPGRTWMFYESTRTRFPLRAGDSLQRSFMKRILEEGERETSLILDDPETAGPEISVESDRVALAARRLYSRSLPPKERWQSLGGCGGTRPSRPLP
jgi:phenylpropionate dioxygenase-like ring-hydroxylating dioxygenase large terminal subunit